MTQNILINEFDEIIRWPKYKSDKTYIIKILSSVGVGRFELPTSSSRTTRANRAALHPES